MNKGIAISIAVACVVLVLIAAVAVGVAVYNNNHETTTTTAIPATPVVPATPTVSPTNTGMAYWTYCSQGNWAAAYDLLTADNKEITTPSGLQQMVGSGTITPSHLIPQSETINGNEAEVVIHNTSKGTLFTMVFHQESGVWKLSLSDTGNKGTTPASKI